MLKSNYLNAVRFLVQEELRVRQWPHVKLAEAMQMQGRFDVVYKFLDGRQSLTQELAEGLDKAFGVRAEWWIQLNDLLNAANVTEEVGSLS